MPAKRRSRKAWSGRMAEATHPLVDAFTTSYPVDCRLYPYDIAGSVAHARMLARQRIIPARDASRIVGGLGRIRREFERGVFRPRPQDEDVHMAIERRLIELIGPAGGKLHTARSRNDQIALDLRLYVRDAGSALRRQIGELRRVLGRQARKHADAVMPGFTHLQPAQPVLFAHHLLAYVEMLERDDARLADCLRRANVLPLGSGALAGTTFAIDRAFVARQLAFDALSENSLDAVSDRDFVAELLAALAILGMHLSRFADEIVLWASQQFGFIELPDAFATGSSMMPQKKNPDVGELIRGKTGRLYGNLVNLLTMLKGLPLSYNRDLQEDKQPLFDSVDTVRASLEVLSAMVPRLRIRADRLRAAASAGYTLATELADYLASKGVPFRDAHGVVGAIVQSAIAGGRQLEDLSLAELRQFSPAFGRDVKRWLTLDAAVRRRKAIGGTSPSNVERRLKQLGV
jgi:argininosuccinate lyase